MFTADIGVYEKETRVRQELQEFVLPFRVVVVVVIVVVVVVVLVVALVVSCAVQ